MPEVLVRYSFGHGLYLHSSLGDNTKVSYPNKAKDGFVCSILELLSHLPMQSTSVFDPLTRIFTLLSLRLPSF